MKQHCIIFHIQELFVIIVHNFQAVAIVAKSYLDDGAGFMDLFPEKDIVKIKIVT